MDEAKGKNIFYFHTRLFWKETDQATAQRTSSYSKRSKMVEKEREYSSKANSEIDHRQMVTVKQEAKLKEHKQENFESRDKNTEPARTSTGKKPGRTKQMEVKVSQKGKKNCEILSIMLQILSRLNKLEERQENKEKA